MKMTNKLFNFCLVNVHFVRHNDQNPSMHHPLDACYYSFVDEFQLN